MITGFKEIDTDYPLKKGELVCIAGRPGMGKTSLVRSMLENNFEVDSRASVIYLDLYNQQNEIFRSMLASLAKVPNKSLTEVKFFENQGVLVEDNGESIATIENSLRYFHRNLDEREHRRVFEATKKLENYRLFCPHINDRKKIDLMEMLSLYEPHIPEVLVIDPIQMLDISSNNNSKMAEILKNLKVLALEKNILVIVISELSSRVEERCGHRPMLSDLRNVWGMEDTADKIIFLLRREYYDPLDKPGIAEVIFAKNRNGKVGSVILNFMKETCYFIDYKSAQSDGFLDDDDFSEFSLG